VAAGRDHARLQCAAAELSDALGLDELREIAIERMSLGQRRRGASARRSSAARAARARRAGQRARRPAARCAVALIKAHAAAGRAACSPRTTPRLLDQLGARCVAGRDANLDRRRRPKDQTQAVTLRAAASGVSLDDRRDARPRLAVALELHDAVDLGEQRPSRPMPTFTPA